MDTTGINAALDALVEDNVPAQMLGDPVFAARLTGWRDECMRRATAAVAEQACVINAAGLMAVLCQGEEGEQQAIVEGHDAQALHQWLDDSWNALP